MRLRVSRTPDVDLVLVSLLRRTLQTATGARAPTIYLRLCLGRRFLVCLPEGAHQVRERHVVSLSCPSTLALAAGGHFSVRHVRARAPLLYLDATIIGLSQGRCE